MATITIKNGINNTSLQIGDVAYYIPNNAISNTGDIYHSNDISFNSTYRVGTISGITSNSIIINNPNVVPAANDFIMFRKNENVNNTSLIGYYAEVKLINDSTEEAELYSLSSDIAESSK